MQSVTFRLLEVFQSIVDNGSITAASTALSLSQPTVSLQLKKLTSVVGMPLFVQTYGQLTLTEAGEAVYQCAQEVLGSHSRLESQIQALQGVEVGILKIAVVTTAKYVIPPILSPFCQQHPNIDVRFTVGNRATIIDRLQHNQDDIYIFSQPPVDDSLQCTPFMQNKLVVIAPKDFDGPDNCNLQTLSQYKFLLREFGSGTRRAIQEYCDDNGITFNNPMIIESNEAIRLAVTSGLGLAILSEHTLAQTPTDGVKILNVTDFPLVNHWQAVTVKHRQISLAAQAFHRALLNVE
ncbi:LysR substrate-binding domain-containing protein [Alteromonas sp. 14N.309.X.WAT.G.H12]|uniref:LysR substrate-binding domain-containing protein n=1 Tax=Alteromonas sp. 14N.309.X.WAT.G.H12 TaxID=3120824 RepID=UPI002FCEA30B